MTITQSEFGQGYHLITLTNKNGVALTVSDLGARIVSLKVPIGEEKRELILGFEHVEDYLEKDPYIGASIGRTAGRIESGRFTIGQKHFQVLTDPETGHTLHGGSPGFETKKWDYQLEEKNGEASVLFTLTSPDKENGFPGELQTDVRYTLTEDNTWRLTTTGVSDQDTLYNPTNHVYFNLSGDVTQPIDQHTLFLNSAYFAPLRPDLIPLGEKQAVNGTDFDFQIEKALGPVFSGKFGQKELFDGLDHPFFLNDPRLNVPSAKLTSPDKQVAVTVKTEASSVVVFTANFGENGPEMRGKTLAHHGGITFETQTAPGAEQFPAFGSIWLKAGQPMQTTTIFQLEF
ncbi:aldose 1-epimerase [Enterococcus florum]|uniref:Aldose 1-epimerase n=1 Tax=Enterococcus florum TaxID=2480627 RepID=A0A4V0WQ00_9ENTE|nr:galactose-1-epimerase [Enterococcus florum]GCF95629.1 aldose 1-epimerase [Enterococcus florum]